MPTPTDGLAIADLVIYILFALPVSYILARHGWNGALGWGYLLVFCMLRIIGSGMQLSNPSSKGAAIISGIGSSPLLLALLGVVHESSQYICEQKPRLLRWYCYVAVHLLVGMGIGLIVAGSDSSSSSGNGQGVPSGGKSKFGTFVLLLVWGIELALGVVSYRRPKFVDEAYSLISAAFLALPFLGIRIIYTFIALFDQSINPYTGPIAYRVVFEALMEYIVAIVLIAFGIGTRNVGEKGRKCDPESGVLLQQPLPQPLQQQQQGVRNMNPVGGK